MCTIFGYFKDDLSQEVIEKALQATITRGPDDQRIVEVNHGWLGFQRLSIMGLSPEGMQPFHKNNIYSICNGEIYGFRPIRDRLIRNGVEFISQSDCEILIPLYEEKGVDMFKELDAEYAMILYDANKDKVIAARDPMGIRPLYYGYDEDGAIVFASEPKNLINLVEKILPFPPGYYYEDGNFVCYRDMREVKEVHSDSLDIICKNIHDKLIAGIDKRLDADAPVGFLLSGGLDSSLVCAIAAKQSTKPIRTFAIGMDIDAIDLKYARQVAKYIGANHTEVIINQQDVIDAIEPVIRSLATYDITTIRASIGMYLVCKYIHEHTNIRVLLSGEISDELFGYKYTDFAPSAEEFQKESEKRIHEIHMYDVLRADRCIAVNSLEARVPFGDLDFVEYCMSIDPELKLNKYGKGKYLLRHAFEEDELLPESILMREKAAFSDAVGHSLKDDLAAFAARQYTDEEFKERQALYTDVMPINKESLLYRDIFEKYYPNQSQMIPAYWMPNKEWPGCNVDDPSARVLSNYGDSGK